MITITELLGSSSVAGDRLTINANFLLIENEINDLENNFNINTVTGAMDISNATSGQFKAKSGYFNTLIFPAAGTPNISMYGTGASAGNGSFSGTLSTKNLTISGTENVSVLNVSSTSSFGATASFNGIAISFNELQNGPTGINTEKNIKASVGAGITMPSISIGGGGITGTYSVPYALSGQESVIYADCGYVSSLTLDASNKTGFYLSVVSGTGGTESAIPNGYKITVINTNPNAGVIGTGVTGPISSQYYTGFNISEGQYNTLGITIPSGAPYRSSITLMWEPRINQSASSQKGSWVVMSSSMVTGF